MPETSPTPLIEGRIYFIRGNNVLLDSDLAELYQVTTGNLNLAVRRNRDPISAGFHGSAFEKEFADLRLQIARASWGGRRIPPYAFTEQGVAMLSGVLNSKRAIEANIAIMRTFVRLRQILASDEDLARKVAELQQQQQDHGQQIQAIFDTIQHLIEEPIDENKRRMGFPVEPEGREVLTGPAAFSAACSQPSVQKLV